MASDWDGLWRNQYGSTIDLLVDGDGRVTGTFRTALTDSGFHGLDVPLHGVAHGDVIGFTSAAESKTGPAAVSYTGILRDGRLEMLWHMVAGRTLSASAPGEPARIVDVGTWRAFATSLDTFERAA